MFRIMGELVEGFDKLSNIEPAVTIYGSARLSPEDELYRQIEDIAHRLGQAGFSIITGGGPGAMEAANRGALRAEVASIGLNIDLPQEQELNPYTTLSITFDHFFVRKVMLVKYATAFVFIPGGLGTLDELAEVLVLIQTGKVKPFPVVLFNSGYWKGLLDWLRKYSLASGYISESDLRLLRLSDEPDEVVEIVKSWYWRQAVTGRQALL